LKKWGYNVNWCFLSKCIRSKWSMLAREFQPAPTGIPPYHPNHPSLVKLDFLIWRIFWEFNKKKSFFFDQFYFCFAGTVRLIGKSSKKSPIYSKSVRQIFHKNGFRPKLHIFAQKFRPLSKIEIFDQNYYFCTKVLCLITISYFRFLIKLSIFNQKFDF